MRQLAGALKHQVPRGELGLCEEGLGPALGPHIAGEL